MSSAVVHFEPVHGIHTLVTGPAVVCAFDNGCSDALRHFGGFDEHHPWPLSLGGAIVQQRLVLCPNHHRRQHALVRYLVECVKASLDPDYRGVLVHYTPSERAAATRALSDWETAGKPSIDGWPCLAATAT